MLGMDSRSTIHRFLCERSDRVAIRVAVRPNDDRSLSGDHWTLRPNTRSVMRLRIAHSTSYRYEPPATGVIQILRHDAGQP